MTTEDECGETQPSAFVTVKVYVPEGMVKIVMLVPVPEVITPPGVRVTDHVPAGGKSLNTTLPVDAAHVGCVIVPTTGAVGVDG